MMKHHPDDTAASATTPDKAQRNVTLLPRHWRWLSDQPRGISATLRLLVEEASRDVNGRFRREQLKETCYFLMRDRAGDSHGFEDAVRALFQDDLATLEQLSATWPKDVGEQVMALATQACRHPQTNA